MVCPESMRASKSLSASKADSALAAALGSVGSIRRAGAVSEACLKLLRRFIPPKTPDQLRSELCRCARLAVLLASEALVRLAEARIAFCLAVLPTPDKSSEEL